MQHSRLSWFALCLLGLPLLMGSKGCEADLHSLDAGSAGEGEEEADGDPAVPSDDAPAPGAENPTAPAPGNPPAPGTGGGGSGGARDAGPAQLPARDGGAAPARDAGGAAPVRDASVTPGRDASTAGRCGTRGGVQCSADEFCSFPAKSQCGALDQGGSCVAKPQACTAIYKPVCGCDGKTHSSDCAANNVGVSVASDGECKGGPKPDPLPTGKMCGGFAGFQCEAGQFCNYEVEAGGQGCDGIADGAGVCQATPQPCTREYNPVCGCNRRTYSTACDAHSKGESVFHTGSCTEVDCKAIGGHPVDGIGPAPKCPAGETEHGSIAYSSGQIAIEGTICCVK